MITILLKGLLVISYVRCGSWDVYAETVDVLVVKQHDFKNELLL